MKPEEARVFLSDMVFIESKTVLNYIKKEALQTAIEALEKQIPRKAIGEHYAHMRCPSCNHRIPSGLGSSSRRRDNWCNYCGQRIEWEDEG